jgi:hypothetical protein
LIITLQELIYKGVIKQMCKECKEQSKEVQEPELTVLETMMNRTSTLNVVEKIVEEVKQDSKPTFKTAWDQIVDKTVVVKLGARNIKHYEDLGYEIPRYINNAGELRIKQKTKIEINIKNIPHNSNTKVKIKCGGRCQQEKLINFQFLYKNCISKNKLYLCIKCSHQTNEFIEQCKNKITEKDIQQCIINSNNNRHTNEIFIEKAKNIWGNEEFDYPNLNYKNTHTKIKIKHNKCGNIYEQTPGNHLSGQYCPYCCSSKGEKIIRKWLIEHNIRFIEEYWFEDCKNIKVLRFDFYLLDYNILIEYDGLQHFYPACFNGIEYEIAEKNFEANNTNDIIKDNYCLENNIPLLRIPYWENKYINEILEDLFSKLQVI